MDLADASRHWTTVVEQCDHLVAVHRHRGGPGRRYEEMAINRAIVVLAVAAWQAAVEDMVTAALDAGTPAAGSPLTKGSYDLLAGSAKSAVARFSTPNAEKSRELFLLVGYDPRPTWVWATGRFGRENHTPADVANRLNQWLKLRHAIAHGASELPALAVLDAIRTGRKKANPPLVLRDAENCLGFVRRLTKATGAGMAHHLAVTDPGW
ncbi:MAG: hypothetical protein HGA44_06005 [Cellulomonadaceae bacterium]|nr:hypothetical protein [Cellulomonadaceae bacterium]